MESTTIDDLLRALQEAFLKLWTQLPDSVKARVREEWKALLNAITAARASGVGSAAEFRAILEALKNFLAALIRTGAAVPKQIAVWIQILEQQIAALEAGAAGASLTC